MLKRFKNEWAACRRFGGEGGVEERNVWRMELDKTSTAQITTLGHAPPAEDFNIVCPNM